MYTLVRGKTGANVEFGVKIAISAVDGLAYLEKLFLQDELDRIAIEGNLGEGKRRYRLGLIKEKLQETSETTIMINLIVMNLAKEYRELFVFFLKSVLSSFQACSLRFAGRIKPAAA